MNALTRTLAGELRSAAILVNAVCPGWVATDMGGAGAPRSVADGAAGFFSPAIPADYHAEHKPLIDGSDVRGTIGNYEDYPELFVRWFEWGAFQPVMRAHGERNHNEVWSYGKQA